MAAKKLELRLAPAEGTQLHQVFSYLIRNQHLVGDGRSMAAEAITAFYLPFALEQAGADPKVVHQVARDCMLLLERHRFHLAQTFGLEWQSPMISADPLAAMAGQPTPNPADPEPESSFLDSLDANYLFEDE
ncbi:hypothetical protein BST81_09100 [Leptolyngbya sp. 'hensonii']|uniref:hypothetical protein n=1 Tax=Leptolyngbya sp. 'hensonii' TaxID=1922337 RepID=UPI00094FE979|nr:hypothetical protein [Leptolyngbya sp. 'hensonii']OLP18729.1 hypothetical protein BST81_09100 [Leptolyngbya sp. 'hensonii']